MFDAGDNFVNISGLLEQLSSPITSLVTSLITSLITSLVTSPITSLVTSPSLTMSKPQLEQKSSHHQPLVQART